MSSIDKDKKISTSPKGVHLRPKRKKPTGRRQIIIISIILAVLVVAVGGVFYYQFNVAPFRKVVLSVDNDVIRMDYFLKRAKTSGAVTSYVLQQLVEEEIIKLDAPQLGIQVTAADLDEALRQAAAEELLEASSTDNTDNSTTATAASITEEEYSDWYEQQVTKSRLSDTEYRELMRIRLMASKIQEYLLSVIPGSAEQVHLHVIQVANLEDANNAKARMTSGESFADVAASVSLDTDSAANGGDLGWVPQGAYGFESVTFSLDVGQVSDPIPVDSENPDTSQYLLFMVSEKDADRTIDESSLDLLLSNYINGWLYQQMSAHDIRVVYNFSDEANDAWVTLQLASMPSLSTNTTVISKTSTSTTTTATGSTSAVDYSFGLYEDAACKNQITEDSVIDWGSMQQGSVATKTVYVKNLGDESSEPVIFVGMDMGTDMAMESKQVALTGDSVEEVTISLAAATKSLTGTRTFTVMCSRGDMVGGYCLFTDGQATVIAAPTITTTSETTTTQAADTSTTQD